MEALEVIYIVKRGYVAIISIDYDYQLLMHDYLEQNGNLWKIIGVESFRPTSRSKVPQNIGLLLKPVGAISDAPQAGDFIHLGKKVEE